VEHYRDILKKFVKFAKREYQEKKPNSVKVLRTKSVRFLSLGGAFKNYVSQESQNPRYIVLVEYKEQFRLYLFTKEGVLINGINQIKNFKFIKKLQNNTITEYKLPK
jgi:hypothetical protein